MRLRHISRSFRYLGIGSCLPSNSACRSLAAIGLLCAFLAPAVALANPIVPGANLGQFRHGTYPSLGANTLMGVDLVASFGTAVHTFADGVVTDLISTPADPNFGSLGYLVLLKHPAQLMGRDFYTLYLHLNQRPDVETHEIVYGGRTPVGKVGKMGR